MSFEDKCVHCDHYREKAGECCFCHKMNVPNVTLKSREQHLAELELEDEIPEGA